MSIFSVLGAPLGYIMHLIYNFIQNYGVTLVIFTILIRLVFIPISIKQQKGMVTMAKIKPKMDDLQKKYGNNREKLNQELTDLYAREKYSPLSSCLPLLLQFVLLFGVIDVIYYPLKHILQIPKELIAQATTIATEVLGSAGMSRYSAEISIINAVQASPDQFSSLGSEVVSKIASFDMNFFGIHLGSTPTYLPAEGQDFGVYLLLLAIPLLSGLTAMLMSYITMGQNKATTGEQGAAMNSMMIFMMPLMSVYIGFQVPAGVGFYWLLTNIIMLIQTMILNKYMNPGEMAKQAQKEAEEELEKEKAEKAEARKKAREEKANGLAQEKALSQKEINRQRLAEARRRDAEKYGEVYEEVTDKDVSGK